jgi:hypothetical protein
MSTQEIQGLEKANEILAANTSPRSRTLALFEAEVDGTRFDQRPPWTSDLPIYDRKPAIVYHVVESSIESKIDLMLGSGRMPAITSGPDEDEGEDDAEDGLGEEESKTVDKLICSLVKEARLGMLWREMYGAAQGCGTSPALLGSRKGRLFAETLPAKWATPTRDENRDLVSVEIKYPYIETALINGKWTATCKLYRRVIDATQDMTFAPAEARIDGIEPKWAVQSTTVHGLGFVPVVWYRHHAPMQNIASEDGYPVHRTLLDQLEAIDLALSQRHHGALTSLPQIIEIGVEPGYNPTGEASDSMAVQVTQTGGTPGPSNPVRGQYRTQGPRRRTGARKKGPNHAWQYESADTKVSAINTPGEALQAIDAHIKDLRSKICETLAYVPLDPESIKYAATVSGKALEILRARELNRVSRDREVFGEDVILATVDMLLRIALKLGTQLRTPRLKKALPVLAQFQGSNGWTPPLLDLKWPDYFKPDAEDEAKIVTTAREAYDAGAITRRTQVEAVKRIFGIANVDVYLKTLEAEKAERDAANAEAEAGVLAKSIAGAHASLNGASAKPTGSGLARTNPENGSGGSDAASDAAKKNGQGKARPGANR